MSRRDNFMFDMDNGDFYIREHKGKCTECELPSKYCNRVKCIQGHDRYIWKKHNEIYEKYLESIGLGPKKDDVIEDPKDTIITEVDK